MGTPGRTAVANPADSASLHSLPLDEEGSGSVVGVPGTGREGEGGGRCSPQKRSREVRPWLGWCRTGIGHTGPGDSSTLPCDAQSHAHDQPTHWAASATFAPNGLDKTAKINQINGEKALVS